MPPMRYQEHREAPFQRVFDSYQAHFQDATRATFRVKQAVSRQAMRCACGVSKRIFLAVGTIVEPRREEQHGPGAITNQPRAHEAMREVGSLVVPRLSAAAKRHDYCMVGRPDAIGRAGLTRPS